MSTELLSLCVTATLETLYMSFVSGALAMLFGIPLGVSLFVTRVDGLHAHATLYQTLSGFANTVRSLPFLILMVAMIPLTRFIVGTSIGNTAAIVPLTFGAIPFVARLIENSLLDVQPGLIEAGLAMGARVRTLVWRILLPEALPSIINGMTIMLITLVGYSAMAGTVGAGGLGDLAIRYGYQRFDTKVMVATILILIVLVQLIQHTGDHLARRYSHFGA